MQTAKLNTWDASQVERAERLWGHTIHQYSRDLFDFVIGKSSSFLDLGCGFGRFLEYLIANHPDPDFDYIGYDSSPDMIARIQERFPLYSSRVFVRDITQPIVHHPQAIIASAVLIHLTIQDQIKILTNISANKPKIIGFDINCPNPKLLRGKESFEKIIGPTAFRMTWQSPEKFQQRLTKLFPTYKIEPHVYDLKQGKSKVMFFLEAHKRAE